MNLFKRAKNKVMNEVQRIYYSIKMGVKIDEVIIMEEIETSEPVLKEGVDYNKKNDNRVKVKKELSLLLDELESLGFYKYLDSGKINEAKTEAIKSGYIYGDTGREFLADEEDLSEGGVGTFIEEISSFLVNQGIHLDVNNEDFSEEKYEIQVNGGKYILYTQEDMENEEYVETNTRNTFSIINKLLEETGSNERMFALYGWNDLVAVFLTNEMYDKIIRYEQDEKERPRKL